MGTSYTMCKSFLVIRNWRLYYRQSIVYSSQRARRRCFQTVLALALAYSVARNPGGCGVRQCAAVRAGWAADERREICVRQCGRTASVYSLCL